MDTRFGELDQRLAVQEATDAAITSRAIHLQVLGLALASVGGPLTAFATLGS